MVVTAAFCPAPNDRLLAFGGRGKKVGLYDLQKNKRVDLPIDSPSFVWTVEFSRDGSKLLADAANEAVVWQLRDMTRTAIQPEKGRAYRGSLFSPDGRHVVALSYSGATVWPVPGPEWALTGLDGKQGHNGQVIAAAARPTDPDLLATAGADGTARVWRFSTRELLYAPLVHSSRVLCAAFSPDGKFVATGCDDGSVRLWDIATGTWTGAIHFHHGAVTRLAFKPQQGEDAPILVTASNDGTVKIWPIPQPIEGTPEYLELLFQVSTGMEATRFSNERRTPDAPTETLEGPPRVLRADEWQERKKRLSEMQDGMKVTAKATR